jgi:copper chaperone
MTHTIHISGMTCNHCVMAVKKELSKIEGLAVKEVQIGSAVVEAPDGAELLAAITAAVEEAGFTVLRTEP